MRRGKGKGKEGKPRVRGLGRVEEAGGGERIGSMRVDKSMQNKD